MKEQLEAMIDSRNLHWVLSELADVCTEKADHIRENWQDEGLAEKWDNAAHNLHIDMKRLPNVPGIS